MCDPVAKRSSPVIQQSDFPGLFGSRAQSLDARLWSLGHRFLMPSLVLSPSIPFAGCYHFTQFFFGHNQSLQRTAGLRFCLLLLLSGPAAAEFVVMLLHGFPSRSCFQECFPVSKVLQPTAADAWGFDCSDFIASFLWFRQPAARAAVAELGR